MFCGSRVNEESPKERVKNSLRPYPVNRIVNRQDMVPKFNAPVQTENLSLLYP